jgi:homoprotocatechuate degradation regulator HpaR
MAIQQFSQSLPMMLYRTLDVVMPRFRRIFKEFGLTEQQWRVLRVLWEQDRLAFHELASITLIPRPSLVGIIDRLRDAGLVERVRCEKDRRIVYVRVTAAGADIQEQVMPLVQQAYFELRLSVDDDVWHQLLDGLGQISSLEEGKHTG